MEQACYRKLNRYKYQLLDDYGLEVKILGESIDHSFIQLTPSGNLFIKRHYAWDGPSGPSIDTLNFMRGSLVHDVLYQLMRLGALDVKHRKHADRLLKEICIEDGMSRFRAAYVYWAVRAFGASHAAPGTEPSEERICVPAA